MAGAPATASRASIGWSQTSGHRTLAVRKPDAMATAVVSLGNTGRCPAGCEPEPVI